MIVFQINHDDGFTEKLFHYQIEGQEGDGSSIITANWFDGFSKIPSKLEQGRPYQILGISEIIGNNYPYFESLLNKTYEEPLITDCSTQMLLFGQNELSNKLMFYAAGFMVETYPEIKQWCKVFLEIDKMVSSMYFPEK